MTKSKALILYQSLDKEMLLPPVSELLNLYLKENRSQKQIAEQLNKPLAATRAQIAKALFELRKASNDPEYMKANQILYSNKTNS
jgi:hypothetical protein